MKDTGRQEHVRRCLVRSDFTITISRKTSTRLKRNVSVHKKVSFRGHFFLLQVIKGRDSPTIVLRVPQYLRVKPPEPPTILPTLQHSQKNATNLY